MVTAAKVPERHEIDVQHTWDLSVIFATDGDWEAATTKVDAIIAEVAALQGTLGKSSAHLLNALKAHDALFEQADRMLVYARQRKDENNDDPAGQAMESKGASLYTKARAAVASFRPEILAIPPATLEAWLVEEPALAVYGQALQNIMRLRPHVRSAEVEAVMAEYGDVTRAPSDLFIMLTNNDLKFPSVLDEQGNPTEISQGRYSRFMLSPDRRLREEAFKKYFATLHGVRNTTAVALGAHVRGQVLESRLRGYGSAVEAALTPNHIPVAVYENLLNTVNAHLPKLHRYVRLRRQIMKLPEIHFYDMYSPLVEGADIRFRYDEAMALTQAAFKPLGAEYAAGVEQAYKERWIDVYENRGKTSGAYSGGAYGTPPYILLNYQDRPNDMFTLAHEMGHSLHTYFAHRTQPYVYSGYTIFLAEIASTLNELLLADHLLKNKEDAALQKELIVQQIEDIRLTILRQTMFAQFELDIHRKVEAGEALTAEGLSGHYAELVKRWHGPDLAWDDEMGIEWVRVPHFYYNFYVFQYATGLSSALALSKQILGEGQPAIDRYLTFLRSGSSRPSVDILRDAGVDMTTPAPIEAAMQHFDALLDKLETLF
jgi:oligoendopeptidase F